MGTVLLVLWSCIVTVWSVVGAYVSTRYLLRRFDLRGLRGHSAAAVGALPPAAAAAPTPADVYVQGGGAV